MLKSPSTNIYRQIDGIRPSKKVEGKILVKVRHSNKKPVLSEYYRYNGNYIKKLASQPSKVYVAVSNFPSPKLRKITASLMLSAMMFLALGPAAFADDASSTPAVVESVIGNPNASSTPALTEVLAAPDVSATPDAAITNVDPGSTASSTINSTSTTEIINNNNATSTTDAASVSNSGANNISAGGNIGTAQINTGDVNVYANVLNIINTNSVNSDLKAIIQNFNDLNHNLVMDSPDATPQDIGNNMLGVICDKGVECNGLTSYFIKNNNNALVQNTVLAAGQSGANSISGNNSSASISSGNVNAVVNILNIVNTNAVNSRWTVFSVNIFGNWQGDLVLPSELFFIDAGQNSKPAKTLTLNVNNNNQASIHNNVSAGADSGANGISGSGDINSAQIQTGDSKAAANVGNYANINLVGSTWFLGLVNTLGSWSGNIFSLPDSVNVNQSPNGLSFFYTNAGSGIIVNDIENGNIAENLDINNSNQATINNNVDVSALSGGNSISGNNLNSPKIVTGNSKALANVLNFANTNLVNANMQLGLVNIFGSWKGNIVFGFPDLGVAERIMEGDMPTKKGQTVTFNLVYTNGGSASMDSALLDWHYDPTLFAIDSASGGNSDNNGTINFELSRVRPHSTNSIIIKAHLLMDLVNYHHKVNKKDILPGDDTDLHITANIWGNGPENNVSNNSTFIRVASGGSVLADNIDNSAHMDPLSVRQVHRTSSKYLQPGSNAAFTIIADNNINQKLSNVTITDTLTGPDGQEMMKQDFPLGNMEPNEEVSMDFDLTIPDNAKIGKYTNSITAVFTDAQGNKDSLPPYNLSFVVNEKLPTISVATITDVLAPNPDEQPATKPQISLTKQTRKFTPLAGQISHDNNLPPGQGNANTANFKSPTLNYTDHPVPSNAKSEILFCLLIAVTYATANSFLRMRKQVKLSI